MTIKVTATRKQDNSLHLIRLEVTEESISLFKTLVDRALNCWDNAPKELKDLGDMLTHERITQDHTYTPINSKHNHDYYTPDEQVVLDAYRVKHGQEKFLEHVNAGTVNKVLDGTVDLPKVSD